MKDQHNKTGTGRKKWRFYDALDSVLGNKPATMPPEVVDTLADSEKEELEGEELTDQDVGPTEVGYSSSSSVGTPKKVDDSKDLTVINEEQSVDRKVKQEKKPIKKRGRESRVERMSEMMDKVMKSQEESDRKFLGLEEKQIRLEEYQLEREERMKRDESFNYG